MAISTSPTSRATTGYHPAAPCSCQGSTFGSGGCSCSGSTGGADYSADYGVGLERTRYFARQRVGPDDMTQDQIYHADRSRRHNRFLHGWGIACGLVVVRCGTEADGQPDPCLVKVSAGYGLDPYGNEVFVPADVVVDLCHESTGGGLICPPSGDPWCGPVEAPRSDQQRYLAIRHTETDVKPVVGPTGCSCDDTSCEYSRIRDGFEFTLLDELPSHYDWPCIDPERLCDAVDVCPPCPDSGWVVLASVRFSDGIPVLAGNDRRYLLSLQKLCNYCDDRPGFEGRPQFGGREMVMVGVASANPDATINIPFYADERPARAMIAVSAAEIAGLTAAELKESWDAVTLFNSTADVAGGAQHQTTAGLLLAHSRLNGDSIIDSVADLEVRIGHPIIAPTAYSENLAEAEAVLDNNGLQRFRSEALANARRIGELDVEALASVSTVNAKRLRAVGINTLDDLYRAEKVPELSASAAAAVERARVLLARIDSASALSR